MPNAKTDAELIKDGWTLLRLEPVHTASLNSEEQFEIMFNNGRTSNGWIAEDINDLNRLIVAYRQQPQTVLSNKTENAMNENIMTVQFNGKECPVEFIMEGERVIARRKDNKQIAMEFPFSELHNILHSIIGGLITFPN